MTLFSKLRGLFAPTPQELRETFAEVMESREMNAADVEGKSSPSHWNNLFVGEGMNGNAAALSDPYNLSPWVSRAIKTIAQPIAQVDLKFSVPSGGSEVQIDDPEVMAFWNRPGKGLGKGVRGRLSRFDVIEATVGWLCLKGSFFWLLDDTWMDPRIREKSPFIIARPDRMRAVMDDGELVAWCYMDARGRRHDLIPDQVVTSGFWNPEDEMTGSAPMDAARQAAESDYAAGRFWKSLSEANGDLGETVIAPNGITPEQQQQIVLAMRRKREASRKGRYLPSFHIGDVKTEDAKIKSPDISAVTQRLQNRHEVYIAFGVPPSFAEVVASYSVGSASDRFKLIEETCQPIGAKIAEAAEMVESMRSVKRPVVIAGFGFENHSTMQQVRSERIETAKKMHERGVPWQVINDHLQLGLDPFPGWEVSWLPFNLMPVGGDAKPKAEAVAPPVKSPALNALDELEVLMRGCQAHMRTAAPAAPEWARHMNFRAPYVKRIRMIVEGACFKARKETLAKIDAAAGADKAIRSGAFDFIFDLVNFLGDIVEPVMTVVVNSYTDAHADLVENELPAPEAPDENAPEQSPLIIPADPAGLSRLQARKNFIKDASEEIWTDIRDTLDAGIQAGESYEKLSERVRTAFNGITKTKAMRIAVTETSIAMESGRNDAMRAAGVQWKEWITSDDEKVRDTHVSLNFKRVRIDEAFIVGGAAMMYPCDPNGPAKEIINCRCIHGPSQPPVDATIDDVEGNNPDPAIPF